MLNKYSIPTTLAAHPESRQLHSQFRMGGCSCLPTHDLGPDILRPPTDLILRAVLPQILRQKILVLYERNCLNARFKNLSFGREE